MILLTDLFINLIKKIILIVIVAIYISNLFTYKRYVLLPTCVPITL